MRFTNRIEVPLYAFFFGLSIILSRFAILPAHISCFVSGVFVGLGFIFIIVSFLPQAVYKKMPYRKWLENRVDK